MAVNEVYRRQVALLIKTLPLVAAAFCRYRSHLCSRRDRESSRTEIDAAIRRIGKEIERGVPGALVSESAPKGEKYITKLIVPTTCRSGSRSRRCCEGVYMSLRSGRFRPARRKNSVLPKCWS
jgi:hypothetical protein